MNRRIAVLLSITLLLVSFFSSIDKRAMAVDFDESAAAAVETYLNFLILGDIDGVKSVLSSNLLREKAPVLASKAYDELLRSRYRNATFKIVDTSLAAANRIKVDTEILLDGGHLMEASFIVVQDRDGHYLIDEEVQ